MSLLLNEEQTQLKDNAKRLVQTQSPVSALRKLRDDKNELGYDADLWQSMVELGWPAILVSEDHGGIDLGISFLAPVLEECGRNLVSSPLLSTALIGAAALEIAGSKNHRAELLPKLAEGKILTALALEESSRHKPELVNTEAKATANGFELSGRKQFVVDGHIADYFIVTARTESGMSLFLLDSKREGVSVQRTFMVDSCNAASVSFDQVSLTKEDLLGELDAGMESLTLILDLARIGLAAEMLGNVQEIFERTVLYLKERQQFGVPIGSFQALQHRAAEMFCEIELCKSVVASGVSVVSQACADTEGGLRNLGDAAKREIAIIASVCQVQLCDSLQLISNEGVQMHGGIGMTDEHEIGFYLKRARVSQQFLGDSFYHKNRYAEFNGY